MFSAGWMWLFISADWRPSYSGPGVRRREGETPLARPVCRVTHWPGLATLNSQVPTSPSPSPSAPDPWYEISRKERSVYIDLEKVINKNIAWRWDIVFKEKLNIGMFSLPRQYSCARKEMLQGFSRIVSLMKQGVLVSIVILLALWTHF